MIETRVTRVYIELPCDGPTGALLSVPDGRPPRDLRELLDEIATLRGLLAETRDYAATVRYLHVMNWPAHDALLTRIDAALTPKETP